MPSLVSFGKGNTSGIDLGSNAFWRIMLAATSATEMALVVMYPAADGFIAQNGMNKIALAKVEVNVAKQADEIDNVAKVALQGGTLELDIARATESMNLFKMHSRTKEELFEQSLSNVLSLVRSYWSVRTWLFAGATEKLMLDVGGYQVLCSP